MKNECLKLIGANKMFNDNELDEQDDILRRFEFVVKDYLVSKGYVIGDGTWTFKTFLKLEYKHKSLIVKLYVNNQEIDIFVAFKDNTKKLFDYAFDCFARDVNIYHVLIKEEK